MLKLFKRFIKFLETLDPVSILLLVFLTATVAWAADTKLSALTELAAAPASSDEMYINDGGTSKKIQISNLFNYLGDAHDTEAELTTLFSGKENALTDKASLESTISDVADFAEADGDTYSGTHDFSSATLQIGSLTLDDDGYFAYQGGTDAMDTNEYNGDVIVGQNCGENIAQWDAVYLDNTAGEWMIADADAAGKFPARGVAVAACTNGNAGTILVKGVIRSDGWTWTTRNAQLWLGDGGTGSTFVEVASIPATAGDALQLIGWVIDDDHVFIDPSPNYTTVQ